MPRRYRHLTFEERCQVLVGIQQRPQPTSNNAPQRDGRSVGEAPPGPARGGDEPSQSLLCRSSLVACPSLHDEKEFLQPTGEVKIIRRFVSSGVIVAWHST